MFKIGVLPVWTVLTVVVITMNSPSDWNVFWAALEALGTVAAFFAAVYLAWSERSKDRRRAENQRLSVRTLLRLEIERILEDLDYYLVKIVQEYSAFNCLAFLSHGVRMRSETKDQLERQLALYTGAFDADEIVRITEFYRNLRQLDEARRSLIAGNCKPETYLNTPVLNLFEGLISRTEFEDLVDHRVTHVVQHIMREMYNTGQKIASEL